MYDYFKSVLGKIYNDFSFETFLAILEQIVDFKQGIEFPNQCSTRDRSIASAIFVSNDKLKGTSLMKLSAKNVWKIYTHYINVLIEAVNKYDNIEQCRLESADFCHFVSILKKSFEQVKIYSTNYDTLCLQMFEQDGIYASTSADYRFESYVVYDLEKFYRTPLTYFPLHGCIRYSREPCNKIRFCLTSKELTDLALDNSAGNPNGSTLFTPIISGYNKLQHVNGKPFVFGTQAFANDLQDSDAIITMGYSYNDPHINSYLATFPKSRIISVTNKQVSALPIDLVNINQQIMDIATFINNLTPIELINLICYE